MVERASLPVYQKRNPTPSSADLSTTKRKLHGGTGVPARLPKPQSKHKPSRFGSWWNGRPCPSTKNAIQHQAPQISQQPSGSYMVERASLPVYQNRNRSINPADSVHGGTGVPARLPKTQSNTKLRRSLNNQAEVTWWNGRPCPSTKTAIEAQTQQIRFMVERASLPVYQKRNPTPSSADLSTTKRKLHGGTGVP